MAENYIINRVTENQAKIIFCPSRFINVKTGRRFGKTQSIDNIMNNFAVQNPGAEICYIGLSAHSVKTTAVAQLDKIVPTQFYNLRNCSKSSPVTKVYRNGSLIRFYGGGVPDSLRGGGYDLVCLDEAQDQYPEIWYEILRPQIADRQGRAIIASTPKGKFNWTADLATDPMFTQFSFSTVEGGIVTPEEIEIMRAQMDARVFAQEIMGEIVDFTGGAYYNYNESCHSTETYLPYRDTIITFDFNVSPVTCTMLQQINFNEWVAVEEFTLYNSNTYNLCNAINNYLALNNFTGNLQARGDFEGQKRSSNSTTTDWLIIKDAFKMYRNFDYKIKKCVNTKNRVDSLNTALYNGTIKININKCPFLHKDLTITSFKEGTNDLDSHGNKQNHWSDNVSYFADIDYPLSNKFKSITKGY